MKNIMKNTMQTVMKSVYAGLMIGISAIVYLSVENKLAGSLLFSFGLLTIVTQGFYLYTGKIGFVKKISELADMFIIICGNYAGTLLAALAGKAAGLAISSVQLAEKKLDNDLAHVFVLSMFCGVMMYLAIDNYNKSKNIVFIIAPVMIFILSGFEHSIANMFYFNFAGIHSLKSYGVLFVMLAGNGIGARLFGMKQE
ncbi:MAG: formate/nitrite transporter family protein [Eubacterium sp.]|nr:formate/nitrite transporter family protein [Eubacterium sp.]MCI8919489.1 formate/nitrite transporter family protein [Eubacterium sp.]